jgi:hypothetical protein
MIKMPPLESCSTMLSPCVRYVLTDAQVEEVRRRIANPNRKPLSREEAWARIDKFGS